LYWLIEAVGDRIVAAQRGSHFGRKSSRDALAIKPDPAAFDTQNVIDVVLGSRKHESEDKRPDDFGHCKSAAIDKMKNIPPS
jgi:hypothetical protein